MKKALTITKDNKMIEAGYRLTLSEQRLILACIGQVDSRKSLTADQSFQFSATEFSDLFGISEDRSYSELQKTVQRLFDRYVIIRNPDPEHPTLEYTKTRWVSALDYIPSQGLVRLYFAPKIIPYLSELKKNFTSYKLDAIAQMTSIYAIRLYELLVQWKCTGKREIDLAWLRKQFQIEDKYPAIKDLKKRVLEPAIQEINDHSDLWVTWTQRKTGRKVTHLHFQFGRKTDTPVGLSKPQINGQKRLYGIPMEDIQRQAKPGESWEQAAGRMTREKAQMSNPS